MGFAQQLLEQGKKAKVFGGDGSNDPSQFKTPGAYVSNFAPDITGIAADKALIAGWKKDNPGKQVGSFGPPTYGAVQVILNAIKLACDKGHGTLASRADVFHQVKKVSIKSFRDTVMENMLQMQFYNVIFACIIAFGVVYNTARIALSERGRELASLRVLGLTRGEISFILLGELAVLTLLALPLGIGMGWLLVKIVCTFLDTEMYRIPFVIAPATYGFSVTVVVVAAMISGLVVRRRLDHLDLIAVLKTRE
jgi:hypothetical protein